MLLPKQKGGSGVLNNPGTTYTVVRVGILCQEQFQDALRERLDLRGVRNARIRDWCQAVRIPTNIDMYCFNDWVAQKKDDLLTLCGLPQSFPHSRCA
jgi:hypothetical protein